jgi:hypothetical protein
MENWVKKAEKGVFLPVLGVLELEDWFLELNEGF